MRHKELNEMERIESDNNLEMRGGNSSSQATPSSSRNSNIQPATVNKPPAGVFVIGDDSKSDSDEEYGD